MAPHGPLGLFDGGGHGPPCADALVGGYSFPRPFQRCTPCHINQSLRQQLEGDGYHGPFVIHVTKKSQYCDLVNSNFQPYES